MPTDSPSPLRLVFHSGPAPIPTLTLQRALRIGRSVDSDLLLAHAQVSRHHALIAPSAGRLLVSDLGSRGGTDLNGQRLTPGQALPLRPGDRLRVGPWLFNLTDQAGAIERPLLATDEGDTAGVQVLADAAPAADIAAFARFAAAASDCRSEADLERMVLAEVRSRGGLDGACLLQSSGAAERVRIVCADPSEARPAGLSRRLLALARRGDVLLLPAADAASPEHTQVGLAPAWSVCLRLRAEGAEDVWLYGWRRGVEPPGADLGHYLRGLAELAQALRAALQKRDLAERHARLEADLGEAQRIQRRLLPSADGRIGVLAHASLFRAGRTVSGDLLLLSSGVSGRCDFVLGDVAGSGAGAGLLMAQLSGVLRAALHSDLGLAELADLLNRVLLQIGEGRFASAILGRFHPDESSVELLDAGHGLGFIAASGAPFEALQISGGPPLGILDLPYVSQRLPFAAGARLLLASDGVAELRAASGEAFGTQRIAALRGASAMAQIADLGAALDCWADPLLAADDASALLLWRDG